MPKKILIVDDHPDYSFLLAATLKTKGFETVVANDGDEALALAESEKPDLILLDIMMPRMGGTEVRAQLLQRPGSRDIPIIYLTGLRPPRYTPRAAGRSGGPPSVRTVGKSDDLKELLDAIRDELGR